MCGGRSLGHSAGDLRSCWFGPVEGTVLFWSFPWFLLIPRSATRSLGHISDAAVASGALSNRFEGEISVEKCCDAKVVSVNGAAPVDVGVAPFHFGSLVRCQHRAACDVVSHGRVENPPTECQTAALQRMNKIQMQGSSQNRHKTESLQRDVRRVSGLNGHGFVTGRLH